MFAELEEAVEELVTETSERISPVTDEAREAAVDAEAESFAGMPPESEVFVSAHLTGFRVGWDKGHAAGVAEGIRQAREALDRWDEKDGWGQAPPSMWDALDRLENEQSEQ